MDFSLYSLAQKKAILSAKIANLKLQQHLSTTVVKQQNNFTNVADNFRNIMEVIIKNKNQIIETNEAIEKLQRKIDTEPENHFLLEYKTKLKILEIIKYTIEIINNDSGATEVDFSNIPSLELTNKIYEKCMTNLEIEFTNLKNNQEMLVLFMSKIKTLLEELKNGFSNETILATSLKSLDS